jgi:hypothetical protein
MSNSNVLPFSEWFKIYERAERDFNKTQMIIESELPKYFTRVFEASLPQTELTIPDEITVEKGQVPGASLKADLDGFGDTLSITAAENGLIYEKAMRLSQLVPNFAASLSGSLRKVKSANEKLNIFKLVIAGIGNSTSNEKLVDTLIKDPSLLDSLGITAKYDAEFDVISKGGLTLLDSTLSNDGSLGARDKSPNGAAVSTWKVCAYMNTVNLINWGIGNFKQYFKLTGDKAGITTTGTPVFDLVGWTGMGNLEDFTKVESDRLYLFTDSKTEGAEPTSQSAGQATASSAGKGVWVNFAPDNYDSDDDGKSVVSEDDPPIRELVKQIANEIGENGIITGLNLTWTGPTTYQGTKITGNGSGVTGPVFDYTKFNPDTYLKDKSAATGQMLNSYRTWLLASNLKDALGNRLKGEINFNWKLADLDSSKDSNLTYSIVSKTESTTKVQDTPTFSSITKGTATNIATGKTVNSETVKIYRYVINFNAGSIAKDIEGKLKKAIGVGKSTYSYDSVEAGDSIKYKGLVDGKISDTVVKNGTAISKDADGITLKDSVSGNRITIKKERYISGEKVRKSDSSTGF